MKIEEWEKIHATQKPRMECERVHVHVQTENHVSRCRNENWSYYVVRQVGFPNDDIDKV